MSNATELTGRLRESSSTSYGCQGCMDTERQEAAEEIEALRLILYDMGAGAGYSVEQIDALIDRARQKIRGY